MWIYIGTQVICNYTNACLYLVSVSGHLIEPTTHLSTPIEWLAEL